ncbi:uncharacterized protein H6S33_011867 [Morchella sextelata]|uniref:uncharacterized protein n=1 Tax=Morchella sextelata TaxID=1174677 RepID=UPI001D044F8A|nr:uncharacterized protein H6S33_011867 [Morchella sextelata]KAH0610340.1 hypothetical protein H6S33_011867 [Morchella sextelata]
MLFRLTARSLLIPRAPLTRTLASTSFGGRNPVDVKVDEISEQYAIAKDELEIAVEETEKRSIYAADDRATVREELEKLENLYRDSVSTSPAEQGEEIRRRVEQRIREFKNAVQELNKADLED